MDKKKRQASRVVEAAKHKTVVGPRRKGVLYRLLRRLSAKKK